MKITIKKYEVKTDSRTLEYLIEREQEQYNNVLEIVTLANAEMEGLTENEIKTLGYIKAKPTAIRVFSEIEPLNEVDNSIDFSLVPSTPKRIEIIGNPTLVIGSTTQYQAIVYDQYNQVMSDVEPVIENKTITATQLGTISVKATLGDLVTGLDITVVEKVKTKEEQLQELVDNLILDNLNMQMQIDTLITSNL